MELMLIVVVVITLVAAVMLVVALSISWPARDVQGGSCLSAVCGERS